MIALHISFVGGTPFLWSDGCRTGDIKELRSAVKAVGLEAKILKSNTENPVTWLPSRGNVPVPSSPLVGSDPDKRRKLAIKPFPVTARGLRIRELIELAAIAKGGNIPGSGVIFGNSITWVRQLLDIAVLLVAEEAFLPTALQHGEQWEGRWMPIPGEHLEPHLAKITGNMPAVCRCLGYSSATAPEIPAQS